MHQSISLQIYSEIPSQDSQHDDRALQSWGKNKTTCTFQRNKTNKSPSNLHFFLKLGFAWTF